jgi:PST family polysaccharide transporter
MKIDLIMLESMAQPNQLGIYSAAAKLSEMWYFIPVAICAAFSPLLFKLRNESDVLFEMKLRELYSLLMWGSIAIGIVVSIFNEEIIRIAFGERFGGAGQVFLIHIWSGIFVCIGLVNSVSLLSSNRLYQNFARTFLGALINVILNLVLIPRFGALGAAYATLIAYAFTAWLSMLFFRNGLYEFLLPIKSLSTIPKVIS